MHENHEATDQLEEVSGRWLRDQLRDVAGEAEPPEPALPAEDNPGAAPETSTAQLIEGLAASISSAVTEPIRGLESRREAQQQKLEHAVEELSGKLGDAFVDMARLREEAASAGLRADEAKESAKREVENARVEFRKDAEQLNATSVDLRDGFNRLAEEVGRLQEKVREQHERIDALRFRETQRAKAMSELEKASASLRDALSAAAALSAPEEEERSGS
jgi:uncharacterized coiled-coil DUF342 family protein